MQFYLNYANELDYFNDSNLLFLLNEKLKIEDLNAIVLIKNKYRK